MAIHGTRTCEPVATDITFKRSFPGMTPEVLFQIGWDFTALSTDMTNVAMAFPQLANATSPIYLFWVDPP